MGDAVQLDLFGGAAPTRSGRPRRAVRPGPSVDVDPVIEALSVPLPGQLAVLDPDGQVPVVCRGCERPLRAPQSRAAGIGPVCAFREARAQGMLL